MKGAQMSVIVTILNQCVRIVHVLPLILAGAAHCSRAGRCRIDGGILVRILLILGFLLLQNVGGALPRLNVLRGLHWDWQYKLWQIAVALAFLCLVLRKPREHGLRLPEKDSLRVMWFVLGCMAAFSTGVALWNRTILFSRQGAPPIGTLPLLETVLFQAFMPGLSEELIYRGIILLGFASLFPSPKLGIAGARVGWETPISVVLFHAAHNRFVDPATMAVDPFVMFRAYTPLDWALNILASGFMSWIVLRTRSILPSIVMHGFSAAIGPLLTLIFGG